MTISKIQIRRGTEADLGFLVLDIGELGFTTDTKRVYIGDGVTVGGIPLAVLADVALTTDAPEDATQYVRRDGAWVPLSTSAVVYSVITASVLAEAGKGYVVDTAAGGVILSLPASPTVGDVVVATRIDAVNPLYIARNGNLIYGAAADLTLSVAQDAVSLVWTGATYGWAATHGI